MEKLLRALCRIPDFRRKGGNKKHDLAAIMFIAIASIARGRKTFRSMVEFASRETEWLSQYIDLKNGIPSEDTIRRVFQRVSPAALAFALREEIEFFGKHVAIDGKCIRGSQDGERPARHIVSAWFVNHLISEFQECVPEKKNEIAAIRILLDELAFCEVMITMDAMGCQVDFAKRIVDAKNNYIFALKDNQSCTRHYVEEHLKTSPSVKIEKKIDFGHGRVEKRIYYFSTDIKKVWHTKQWPGIKSVGSVVRISYNKKQKKESVEQRFFISSTECFETFIKCVRDHWSVENNLHWRLDTLFEEDKSKVRKYNAPENLDILRKLALRAYDRFGEEGRSARSKMEEVQESIVALERLLSLTISS